MNNFLVIIICLVLEMQVCIASDDKSKIDTITIHLGVKDTSFYDYAKIHGRVYYFINADDKLYLNLSYTVSGYDMGVAGLDPEYSFKSSAPEAVYRIIRVCGNVRASVFSCDTSIIRICNCESLHPQFFSDEKPIRYSYKNEKDSYFGKCLTFYKNGVQKEEKNFYGGTITYEKSWHENGDWASAIQYKPNSNSVADGSWYFSDRSTRFNTQDTLITETYPDGSRKSLSRFTTSYHSQIEYMFWSPTKKLIKHWKIVEGKKVVILNITDTIIEKVGNLVYVETQTCDSMAINDSLVKVNGFNVNATENRSYYAIYLKASGTIDKNGFLYDGKYYIYDCRLKLIKYLIFSNGKYWGEVKIE